jgi:chaperonin GroES
MKTVRGPLPVVRCNGPLQTTDNGQLTTDIIKEIVIMAKLRPLGDKILVKRVEAESKTKSGIVLPDTAKEKPKRGKILAVGDGKRLDNGERAPFNVKKGDEVIFASYAGTEIKLDGEELMIMAEEDILAVVE